MQVILVNSSILAKEFLEVSIRVNQNNTNFIQPLNKDVEEVFNEDKNKTFRHGKAVRWILKDEAGQLIGRIAAFINTKYKNKGDEFSAGGFGFFECINEQKAADLLLNTARNWLQEQGMAAMDGPINFGERDRWWGLVTEGFQPPLYCMNYNAPYYKNLLENYGCEAFYHQICFGFNPKAPLSEKVKKRHAEHSLNPDFSFKTMEMGKLEDFALDFHSVYNKAWAGHGGLKEMKKEQALLLMKKLKPILDPKVCYFVYHKNQPIALFINLPDLNQWFKYLKGEFTWLAKLKFLWVKATKPCTKFTGLVFGIVPEFQGQGIDSYLIGEAKKVINTLQYSDYEMQWIGDFNPKMINVAENLGDTFRTRQLTTFRFLFDRSKKFERHPLI
jgi:hypothetical protein